MKQKHPMQTKLSDLMTLELSVTIPRASRPEIQTIVDALLQHYEQGDEEAFFRVAARLEGQYKISRRGTP